MDAVAKQGPRDTGAIGLPAECPLDMPIQSLQSSYTRTRNPRTGPKGIQLRRLLVFGCTTALTAAAAYEMYQVLQVGSLTVLEGLVLILFVILFAWIALSFVTSVIGFCVWNSGRSLSICPEEPLQHLSSRTALLLPIYNEAPGRVMARLRAICESLEETNQGDQFDFYILSDSTDPTIWILEELEYLKLADAIEHDRIYYRHRKNNTARKAGNIAEWVTRFGGHYDFMIVLDADSLMGGDTIVRLTAAMEKHSDVGLIQSLPLLLNGETPFARAHQFAARTYGPIIARGFSWWHGAESNYWGHNAIIRVRAFAEHAGLPVLSGRKPFGGHIMSHDFVEAGLMRRGGWAVHMVTSVEGSYEEPPPTVTDYALRDRRWCQGNLQHMAVLPARGFHWMSRLHLVTGIGCYVTAPLWLLFLIVGILISLQAQFIRPEYFPAGATLFPHWPAQDPVRAIWVFGGTMAMLIAPKLLGFIEMLWPPSAERNNTALRGFGSVFLETIMSALIAPIMMLLQSKYLLEIFSGRDAGWSPQRRTPGNDPAGNLVRVYAFPTGVGIALGIAAFSVSDFLFLWMLPVIMGLTFAIPIAALTSIPALGRKLRTLGFFVIPEERRPPAVLARANELMPTTSNVGCDPIGLLAAQPRLLHAHLSMLPPVKPLRRGEIDADLVLATAKIETAHDRDEAASLLTERELIATLSSSIALRNLMLKPTLS